MKQTLIETQLFVPIQELLIEQKLSDRGNLIVGGILATAEEENGNGRYYSRELWDRELKKYNTLINERRALGELDHPEESIISLKNVSHNIIEAWWDGNNIMGKFEILPTPSGNILKTLFENKIKIGVSSRGMGSLQERGGIQEVQDDFELVCFDFVSTPSNKNSWMRVLNESLKVNNKLEQYNKVNSLITEILCSYGKCPIN